ncbi:MAG: DUF1667 domain-containing protein [Candidatus Neomarinimicrobiota bacterium]|jgi:CxxC motif-containing protein|nr:DUF1667 domain-containing protein [Candidatus Neomarinimicrobiota bacterium]MDD3966404.1 DUF1667 domain-containing protein [Candidatus Neomarinimicrobiota bacterium]MDX9780014.1 DUF1667 domain-containing protein [bacterium]
MDAVFTKEITCTVCPVGCKLTIEKDGDAYRIFGNQCKRGHSYAIEELTHPTRMLTTTVAIRHALHSRLPVHSSGPLPKELLFPAMKILKECCVNAPVRCGQVIVRGILKTGVDICASRDMELV